MHPTTLQSSIIELKEQIHTCFPKHPIPADDEIICHACDDCFLLRDTFKGHTWDSLSSEIIDSHHSMALFHPVAHCYYMPAYLLRGLEYSDQNSSTVRDFVIYALCPDYNLFEDILWSSSFDCYNDSQRNVLAQWLYLILENKDIFDADDVVGRSGYEAYWTKYRL